MSATIIAIIVVGITLTTLTTALLTSSIIPIPTDGTVTTPTPTPTGPSIQPQITPTPTATPTATPTVEIGVYSDASFTNEYSSENGITWGAVAPGGSTTKTVYIRNQGTETVTLHLTTENLLPAGAAGKIGVTWTLEDQTLAAGENVNAVLTLSVDSSIDDITSFSIDVIIEGSP